MHNKDDESNALCPQKLYYSQLIKRFEKLRRTLSRSRGHRLVQKSNIEADRALSVKPPLNRHEWLYILDREYPTFSQIFQLDEKDIRRGLEYCIHGMNRFDTISEQKSCWIWTLLALSSDIGTLDSRGMSHIRDLGNTASQLSINLHQGIRHQNVGDQDNSADSVRDDSKSNSKTGKTTLHNANEGGNSSKPYDSRLERSNSMTKEIPSKPLANPRDDVQPQEIDQEVSDADVSGSTDTDANKHSLERARARLLAQLGDNLVQAGIPVSAHDTDGANSERNEQLTGGSQYETKPFMIPTRAEAERQRQLIRIRDSGGEISRESCSPSNDHSTGTEGSNSCVVDLNTRVTIDMILTVVAESYGQRDLLMSRKPW